MGAGHQVQRDNVRDCQRIRNAIAHRSEHAKSLFEREVLGTLPLPQHERTPVGYLRSRLTAYPPETRYENHAAQLLATLSELAK